MGLVSKVFAGMNSFEGEKFSFSCRALFQSQPTRASLGDSSAGAAVRACTSCSLENKAFLVRVYK